jgi:DNA-binding response OmpR family regulator
MIKGSNILVPFVAVLDSDKTTARLIAKGLRQRLDIRRVQAFWEARDAWGNISGDPKLEPYLVITDWIGTEPLKTSFVVRIRTNYPRTKIILYSGRATLEDVVYLQNTKELIDRYIHKDEGIERLLRVGESCFKKYEEDPILSSVRFYLFRCKNPKEPFTVIDNKHYSLIDIYWEMVRGTEIGKITQQAWQSLLSEAILSGKEA